MIVARDLAAVERVARSRRAQGLPARVEDEAVLRWLAELLIRGQG